MNGDYFSNRHIRSRVSTNDVISKSNGVILDNSKAIGAIEAQFRNTSQLAGNNFTSLDIIGGLADATRRDKMPISLFYNSDISVKIPRLKELLNDPTIYRIVEQVSLDGIKFDNHGMFCEPINIASKLKQ